MKIKRKDGRVIEVARDYKLGDGEEVVFSPLFMDNKPSLDDQSPPPITITNSDGFPAGHRPGHLFAHGSDAAMYDFKKLRDAAEHAYQMKLGAMGGRAALRQMPPVGGGVYTQGIN